MLATLEVDFESYTAAGSCLNQAKRYNNVIRPSILPVALTHVAIPTLHLDLGIFPWIFTAFEGELKLLDLRAAECAEAAGNDTATFQDLVSLHSKFAEAGHNSINCSAIIDGLQQELQYSELFGQLGVTDDSHETSIGSIQQNILRYADAKSYHDTQQQQILDEIVSKGKGVEGPCRGSLEPVLQHNHIQRQAYHGGAFVGNHASIALQPDVILAIVGAPTAVVRDRYPALLEYAVEIESRYKKLFQAYGACRRFSHCRKLSTEDISEQDIAIKTFLRLCRLEIVDRKQGHITPKLHLLESHTVPSARRFSVGLGLLAEHSSESIHARFNSLNRDYQLMPNELQRMRAVCQQHLVSTLPQHDALRPAASSRKRKSSTE